MLRLLSMGSRTLILQIRMIQPTPSNLKKSKRNPNQRSTTETNKSRNKYDPQDPEYLEYAQETCDRVSDNGTSEDKYHEIQRIL